MTSPPASDQPVSHPGAHRPSADEDATLRADEQVEARIFWKGLVALAIAALVAFARQRWWL